MANLRWCMTDAVGLVMVTVLPWLLSCPPTHAAKTNKTQTFVIPSPTVCKMTPVKVAAAHFTSGSDTYLESCTLTVDGAQGYFLINYEDADLLCGQTIKMYYSRSTEGDADKELNCTSMISPLTYDVKKTNFVSIRFDNPNGDEINNFSITATPYTGRKSECSGKYGHDCNYLSDHGQICISPALECDGVRNCPGGASDEHDECATEMAVGAMVAFLVVTLLVCVGCGVGIAFFCKRSGRPGGWRGRRAAAQTLAVQPPPVPVPAPVPCYPAGPQVAPPAGYYPPGAVPAGGYQQPGVPPGGYQQPAGVPPGGYQQPAGYQPVATAPPAQQPYPTQTDAAFAAYPGNQPVGYSAQASEVKVPL